MKIGANFRVGPPGGRKDSLWKIPMTWPKFLRLIIEVFTILYGKEEEVWSKIIDAKRKSSGEVVNGGVEKACVS